MEKMQSLEGEMIVAHSQYLYLGSFLHHKKGKHYFSLLKLRKRLHFDCWVSFLTAVWCGLTTVLFLYGPKDMNLEDSLMLFQLAES